MIITFYQYVCYIIFYSNYVLTSFILFLFVPFPLHSFPPLSDTNRRLVSFSAGEEKRKNKIHI